MVCPVILWTLWCVVTTTIGDIVLLCYKADVVPNLWQMLLPIVLLCVADGKP